MKKYFNLNIFNQIKRLLFGSLEFSICFCEAWNETEVNKSPKFIFPHQTFIKGFSLAARSQKPVKAVNVLNLMSIVKYDIHRTYQLTSVGINQKKKVKRIFGSMRGECCRRTAKKSIKLCVWKECVKCFLFDEYNSVCSVR